MRTRRCLLVDLRLRRIVDFGSKNLSLFVHDLELCPIFAPCHAVSRWQATQILAIEIPRFFDDRRFDDDFIRPVVDNCIELQRVGATFVHMACRYEVPPRFIDSIQRRRRAVEKLGLVVKINRWH